MHVVAILHLDSPEEGLAAALAEVLGKTVYEARARLRAIGSGPAVIASYADEAAAGRAAARLRAAGLAALALGEAERESDATRFVARAFELRETALRVTAAGGAALEVPYAEIDLLLRGTQTNLSTRTRTVKTRKFSMSRALLSSGLMLTKTVKERESVTEEGREAFVHVYAGARPPVVLRESGLHYQGLGEAMESSRAANFAHLAAELRRRAPGAAYDDRLISRAGQVAILGPALTPSRYLDVATTLLAGVLRTGAASG